MIIATDDVVAYVVGEELVCATCATKEEVIECSENGEGLVTRATVAYADNNGRRSYCDRCGGRIRA
jgi:hypothetical protein